MNPQVGATVQIKDGSNLEAGIVVGNVTATTADLAAWLKAGGWGHRAAVAFDPSLSLPLCFKVVAGGV